MDIFKRVTVNGNPVYCYGVNLSQVFSAFDPDKTPLGRFSTGSSPAIGLSIEPLYGEYLMNAKHGKKPGLPAGEFQPNSACLLFARVESIDTLIGELQECKKRLSLKIRQAKAEEYRRKFYGKVVDMLDWKRAHPDRVPVEQVAPNI